MGFSTISDFSICGKWGSTQGFGFLRKYRIEANLPLQLPLPGEYLKGLVSG